MTYGEMRDKLTQAVRHAFPAAQYAWVEDFDDSTLWCEVTHPMGCTYYAVPFTVTGEAVTLGMPAEVERVTRFEPVGKAVTIDGEFTPVSKAEDQRLIFGWANVSIRKDGTPVVDSDGEWVPIEDLELAAYLFVKAYRETGEDHRGDSRGTVIESVVFTKEKVAALGLPDGSLPLGWWVGFELADQADFEKIKSGEKVMFSIQGHARHEPVAA